MHRIEWIQPYYDVILNMIPRDVRTILDIGSGNGIFGFILKKTREVDLTGVEPFPYDLKHYDMVIDETWQKTAIGKKYDCIVCLEMIEHMTRFDAIHLLYDVRTICKKAIIATPYSFEQQPAYDDNKYQTHKSLITISDFKKYGYKVMLIGSFSNRLFQTRWIFHERFLPFARLLGIKITNIVGVYEQK